MATAKINSKMNLTHNIRHLDKIGSKSDESRKAAIPDLSQLRKPIDINLSSPRQIAQVLEKGSPEVQDILTYECDVIYECRICRSLFRSLANLISHKRVYCPEKYTVYYKRDNGDGKKVIGFDHTQNSSNDETSETRSRRTEPKKDLTSVVDMLLRKQNNDCRCDDVCVGRRMACPSCVSKANERVALQIDSNEATYQEIIAQQFPAGRNVDSNITQTVELENMSNGGTAILRPDGQCHEVYPDVSARSDRGANEDFNGDLNFRSPTYSEDLTCTTCDRRFATKKTLTLHAKCRQSTHRIGFPCPCCSNIFTNRWCVYRHLFKVHRKTKEQVRKLRSQLQARAYRRPTPRLENTKKSNESARRQITERTQKWMENSELDTALRRCGACGKRFDRKAALVSHLLMCRKKKRTAAARGRSPGPHDRPRENLENRKKSSVVPRCKIGEGTEKPTETSELASTLERCPCGRNFDEKPSLTSHRQTCKKPLNPPPDPTPIPPRKPIENEPQRPQKISTPESPSNPSSKISDKSPILPNKIPPLPTSPIVKFENSILRDHEYSPATVSMIIPETSKKSTEIKVGDVSTLSKDVWDKIGVENEPTTIKTDLITIATPKSIQSMIVDHQKSSNSSSIPKTTLVPKNHDIPEVVYTSIDNSRPVVLSVLGTDQKLGIKYRGIQLPTVTLEKINTTRNRNDSIPFESTTTSNVYSKETKTSLVNEKLSYLANIRKLQCLPCNRKFTALPYLRRHIAVHLRRSRYGCKLCDFEAFLKCDCIAHCNKIHNAKNNRAKLADLIIEVPTDNSRNEKKIETSKIDVIYEKSTIDIRVEKSTEKRKNDLVSPINRQIRGLPKDSSMRVKKRGRPPKSKRNQKNKTTKENNLKELRSLTIANTNEFDDDSDDIADITNSLEIRRCQNSKKNCQNSSTIDKFVRSQSRMDSDPELRKMVMEVIFGLDEKQTENDESIWNDGIKTRENDVEVGGEKIVSLNRGEDFSVFHSKNGSARILETNSLQQIAGDGREYTNPT